MRLMNCRLDYQIGNHCSKGENLYVGGTKGVAVVNVNDIRTAEVPDLLLIDVYR